MFGRLPPHKNQGITSASLLYEQVTISFLSLSLSFSLSLLVVPLKEFDLAVLKSAFHHQSQYHAPLEVVQRSLVDGQEGAGQVERSSIAEGGWVEWLGVVEEIERAHPLADQRDQLEETRCI